MNFRRNIRQTDTGFQMAPMIDMMFLLLIFMMVSLVTAQFENTLSLTIPTADNSEKKVRTSINEIIINIDKDGRMYINQLEVSKTKLNTILMHLTAELKLVGNPIIIRPDRETPTWAVMQVLDICKGNDIFNIFFAVSPSETEVTPPE